MRPRVVRLGSERQVKILPGVWLGRGIRVCDRSPFQIGNAKWPTESGDPSERELARVYLRIFHNKCKYYVRCTFLFTASDRSKNSLMTGLTWMGKTNRTMYHRRAQLKLSVLQRCNSLKHSCKISTCSIYIKVGTHCTACKPSAHLTDMK